MTCGSTWELNRGERGLCQTYSWGNVISWRNSSIYSIMFKDLKWLQCPLIPWTCFSRIRHSHHRNFWLVPCSALSWVTLCLCYIRESYMCVYIWIFSGKLLWQLHPACERDETLQAKTGTAHPTVAICNWSLTCTQFSFLRVHRGNGPFFELERCGNKKGWQSFWCFLLVPKYYLYMFRV